MDMPIMTPIPIPTGQDDLSLWRKVKVWLTQSRKFRLVEQWECTVSLDINEIGALQEITFVVPEGFVFDGASIPRPLWFLLNPYGILLIPGLVHDYIYKYNRVLVIDHHLILRDTLPTERDQVRSYGDGCDQAFADRIFRELAISVNGMKYINWAAYYALALFGFSAWNKHRRADKERLRQTK